MPTSASAPCSSLPDVRSGRQYPWHCQRPSSPPPNPQPFLSCGVTKPSPPNRPAQSPLHRISSHLGHPPTCPCPGRLPWAQERPAPTLGPPAQGAAPARPAAPLAPPLPPAPSPCAAGQGHAPGEGLARGRRGTLPASPREARKPCRAERRQEAAGGDGERRRPAREAGNRSGGVRCVRGARASRGAGADLGWSKGDPGRQRGRPAAAAAAGGVSLAPACSSAKSRHTVSSGDPGSEKARGG